MALKKHELLIAPAAMHDIQVGIDYYKKIDHKLGKRFLESVKSSFRELQTNPYYQVRYQQVRIRTVKNFPYLIHFIVQENKIEVFGVRFDKMENQKVKVKY
jgi:toxin ParE1/3/4